MDIDKFNEAKAHNEAAAKKMTDKSKSIVDTDSLTEKLEKTFESVKDAAKDLAETAGDAIQGLRHKGEEELKKDEFVHDVPPEDDDKDDA